MRVVLDTCILKLATFPSENNASAAIYELAHAGLIEAWVTPAILEEYSDVLGEYPEFVAEVVESFLHCYPLTELSVIRHEPDNRFLECALAADADYIITVNTAPGHFDRKAYQSVRVVTPGDQALDRLANQLRDFHASLLSHAGQSSPGFLPIDSLP